MLCDVSFQVSQFPIIRAHIQIVLQNIFFFTNHSQFINASASYCCVRKKVIHWLIYPWQFMAKNIYIHKRTLPSIAMMVGSWLRWWCPHCRTWHFAASAQWKQSQAHLPFSIYIYRANVDFHRYGLTLYILKRRFLFTYYINIFHI